MNERHTQQSVLDGAEERDWFCPQCGVIRLGVYYDGGAITDDGCCTGCGTTCCRMSELQSLLGKAGWLIEREPEPEACDRCGARAPLRDVREQGYVLARVCENADACDAELIRLNGACPRICKHCGVRTPDGSQIELHHPRCASVQTP